jgi:hypothetical protein
MKMKRTAKRRAKREIGKRPRDREQRLLSPPAAASGSDLPPNEKLQKFADEIYGDTEIPHRR